MKPDIDLAVLFETMAGGVYVVTLDRVISFWNAGAERITGYSADEVKGRACGENLINHCDEAGESLCGTRCPLFATMRDGVERNERVFATHRDGHRVPVRVTARAVRDENGIITGAVETFTDDTIAVEAETRLRDAERLIMTDHLTGLGNRRFLEQLLADRLRDGAGAGIAVLALDIDRFKVLNDNHGHAFGDEVLTVVARTLAEVVTDCCEVVRLGGDEFVIVMSYPAPGEVEEAAARVRAAVASTRLSDQGIAVRVTVSVGAALGVDGDTPDILVKRADDAMLEAKRRGRDAVVHSAHAPRVP